jgi:hypothetical protein
MHRQVILSALCGLNFVLSCPAYAENPDTDSSNTEVALVDPSYLPLGGHLISDSGYSFGRFTNELVGQYKYVESTNSFSQSLQYGILNDLVIAVGGDYSSINESYNYGYFSEKSYETGAGDPSVGVIFRSFHQTRVRGHRAHDGA